MKSTAQNRNLFILGAVAALIAIVTAVALFVAGRDGDDDVDESGTGATIRTARNFLTPVAVSDQENDSVKNDVANRIASQGKGFVIVHVETNLSPNASAQDEVRAIAQAQDNVVASLSGSVNVVARANRLPLMLLEVDAAGARSLAASQGVVSMMEDKPEFATLDDTIPAIGALEVYGQGYSGQGWTVAVLDTGQDVSHHFFADRVLAEACFSSNVAGQSYSICGNGEDSQVGPGAASNCQVDWCDHGTHVVGIAAGNGSGGSGVAKDAGIVAVNVFSDFQECRGQENCIRTRPWDQIQGLNWVLENAQTYNIAAVNMSIGGSKYSDQATCDREQEPRKAAFDRLVAAGIAVVVAAGNESYTDGLGVPSCISSAIAVGSITKNGGVSNFSNSHPMVDIFTYGSSIVSAAPGGGWATLSGTSMASPHVAGAFTVLRSAKPEATVAELFTALAEGGNSFRDPRNGLTRPSLQLDGAVQALLGGGTRPQPTPAPSPRPQPAPSGAPSNDDQDSPTEITSPSFRETIDVRNATVYDDPVIHPTWYCPEGGRFEKTVWYSFTAPANGYLTISTQGSNYDTIVSVWQGSRGAPYQIGCADDDAYPNTLTTTIAGWVAKGTTFRVQVGAWDNGGTLVLNAYFQASNVSATVTDSGLAPVVFDPALSEAPSDLASARPAGTAPKPAACNSKSTRPAGLTGECYKGPAPR